MITVKIFDIEWDLDGYSRKERKDILATLPKTVEYDVDEDDDIDLEGADWLSDDYGYAVKEFTYKTNFEETYR